MPRPRTLRPPFPPPSSINNERARARVSQRVRLLRRCGGRPLGYRAAGRAPGAPSSHQLVPQAHPAWPRRCRIRAARAALAHGALTNDGGGRRPLRETGPRRHRGAGASTPSRAPQRTRLRAARRHGANCRRMERGSGWSKRTIRRSPSRQRRGVSAIDPSARSSASASPGRPDAGGMPRGAAARQGTARAGAMPSDGAAGRVATSGAARGSLGELKCCVQARGLAPKRRVLFHPQAPVATNFHFCHPILRRGFGVPLQVSSAWHQKSTKRTQCFDPTWPRGVKHRVARQPGVCGRDAHALRRQSGAICDAPPAGEHPRPTSRRFRSQRDRSCDAYRCGVCASSIEQEQPPAWREQAAVRAARALAAPRRAAARPRAGGLLPPVPLPYPSTDGHPARH